MSARVQLQSGRMRESLPTNLTSIRLLAAVRPLVHRQLRPLREPGAAMSAPVRLILLMDPHVLRQMPFQILFTNVTVEGFDVGVVASEMLP